MSTIKTLTMTFNLMPAPNVQGVRNVLLALAADLEFMRDLPSVMAVRLPPNGVLAGAVNFIPGEETVPDKNPHG